MRKKKKRKNEIVEVVEVEGGAKINNQNKWNQWQEHGRWFIDNAKIVYFEKSKENLCCIYGEGKQT